MLLNYDPNRKTRVYMDHSPDGISSTVAHAFKVDRERKEQWRTVCNTSKVVAKAEKKGRKLEGESMIQEGPRETL